MAPNSWDSLKGIFPPDVLDALSHNEAPAPAAIQSFRALLEQPVQIEQAIQNRIKQIKREMAALQEEKDKLSDHIYVRTALKDAHAAVSAPIRHLPPDVLYEIARHSMADYPSFKRHLAPLNLSQVSSAWRSIMLHSSRFWSTLYLRVESTRSSHLMRRLEAADLWLQRSGSRPIALFLYVACEVESDAKDLFAFFLNALGRWTPRVWRLGIGGPRWLDLMENFVDIDWDLGRLEQLDFLGQREEDVGHLMEHTLDFEPVGEEISLFQRANAIKSMVISQEMARYLPAFQFLPWNKVTDLCLLEGSCESSDLKGILESCPQLRMATLTWVTDEPTDDSFSSIVEPFVLHKLEKLHLKDVAISTYVDIGHFFTKLSFPQMTHLSLGIFCVAHSLSLDDIPLTSFNHMSLMPSLTHLCLYKDSVNFPTEFVLALLRITPALQTFVMDISFPYTDRHLLDRPDLNELCTALIDDGINPLVPMLEECSFGQSRPRKEIGLICPVDTTVVSRFIRSRIHRPASPNRRDLKRVAFLGSFKFTTDLREEVARISDPGRPAMSVLVSPRNDHAKKVLRIMDLPVDPFSPGTSYFDGPLYDANHKFDHLEPFD